MINRFIFVAILSVIFSSCKAIPVIFQEKEFEEQKIVIPSDEVLEKHAEEISRLYGKLRILSLNEIPEETFGEYKKYVYNGIAYVIVHPSYYVFFHNYGSKKVVVDRPDWDFSKNIVDMFIEDYPAGKSGIMKRMKESERRERDFIRKASSRGRLVILVLPPDYLNHPEYPYRRLDEFARYINEVTGGSPSVIYVESESYKRGYLTSDVMPRLNRFLKANDVKSLLVGGGYVDLCLKDFYDQAGNLKDIEKVDTVPDICANSPDLMLEDKLQ